MATATRIICFECMADFEVEPNLAGTTITCQTAGCLGSIVVPYTLDNEPSQAGSNRQGRRDARATRALGSRPRSDSDNYLRAEAGYYRACFVLGLYLLVGLLVAVAFFVESLKRARQLEQATRGMSLSYKVDEVGVTAIVLLYGVWAVAAVLVMAGKRWLVWVILVGAGFRLVGESAFALGGLLKYDNALVFRLVLDAGAVALGLWCIHYRQLMRRALR